MVERCKTAYAQSRWVRIDVGLGLLLWGILLYALAGGFPPWAWRFLAHVLPQLPQLWAIQGSAVVVPLIGLLLLSLSLFILWGVLVVCVCNVVLYWWHRVHEREDFAMDLLEAERMAEEAVNREQQMQARDEYEQRWQPSAPMEALPTQPVRPWLSEALPPARPTEVLPQVRQPVRQPAQPPVRQRVQEEAYTAAQASRVIGSSGLIRVPSATLSRGEAAMSQPTRRRQVVESPTQTMSVPTRPVPRVPVEPRTQPVSAPRMPVEPRTRPVPAPTRPDTRLPMEPRTQPVRASAHPAARMPVEPRTQPMPAMQPTQAISRQVVERARPIEAPSGPTRALTMREQLRLVPREVAEPEYEDECEETVRFSPITQDITTDDTLPGTERGLFDDDEDDEKSVDDEKTLTNLPTFPASELFRLHFGIGLDTGIARKDAPNEDNLFAVQGMRPSPAGSEPVGLFIVADGMGGHAHGQEASKQAVNEISGAILPLLMRPADDDEAFSELMKEGVHRANLAIYGRNRERGHMMGTTLTAALVVGNRAYIVNVGDSRTYLYRSGEGLTRVTRDHSAVEQLVEDGVIERKDVYTHPKRNVIYRCLGEHSTVDVDMFKKDLQDNDVLILCSDGMWEMVHDDEIERIIMSSAMQPSQISRQLVQAALANGGADNISVVVVCVEQR